MPIVHFFFSFSSPRFLPGPRTQSKHCWISAVTHRQRPATAARPSMPPSARRAPSPRRYSPPFSTPERHWTVWMHLAQVPRTPLAPRATRQDDMLLLPAHPAWKHLLFTSSCLLDGQLRLPTEARSHSLYICGLLLLMRPCLQACLRVILACAKSRGTLLHVALQADDGKAHPCWQDQRNSS